MIPGLRNEIIAARLLANGSSLKTIGDNQGLIINLPAQALDTIATVIKVEIKGTVDAVAAEPKDKMKAGELD